MPIINVQPKEFQNGDRVISYTNTVGTAQETFTFPVSQETIILWNKGSKNISYTIGSNTGTLGKSESVKAVGSFDSISLSSEQGTQAFEVWAEEAGTTGTSPEAIVSLGNQVSSLSSSLAENTSNIKTGNIKKLKQPLCFNTFWMNGYTLSQEKAEVDQLVELGFDGIVITLHLDYVNSVLTTVEIISDIKAAMTYAVEKGLKITCIKLHCTTTATTGATFKTDYQNALNSILSSFKGLSDNLIILNERYDITDDRTNDTWVLSLITSVKNAGFKCGISLSDLQYYGISDAILNALDFIGLNCYPRCGFKGKETTLQDCINAIEISPYKNMLLDLKRRFFTKPVYISEFGIRDYYIYYSAPMEWAYDNVADKSNGQTVLNYFGALFELMNGKVDGIWSWYGVYFPSTIDFFQSWTGGKK